MKNTKLRLRQKFASSFLSALMFLPFACNEVKNEGAQPTRSTTQQKFENFLKDKLDGSISNSGNAIQEQEYLVKFEADLLKFLDSNMVFLNWKGTIDNIRISDLIQGIKFIQFQIVINHSDFQSATFLSGYTVSEKEMPTDSFAQKLKRIPNGSTVYFDGAISRMGGEVSYDIKPFENHIIRPVYLFNLFDVSTSPLTVSENLRVVMDTYLKVYALTIEKYNKKITESEMKRQAKALLPDDLEYKLTDNEKEYCDRLKSELGIHYLTHKAK
jgi:hypothetical protein